MDNIRTIIEKINNGDTDAAGLLYEKYKAEGLGIAYKYVQDRDDAEDMYQDAFLKALTNIDRFDASKEFGPWFHTIIANTCKNFLVKKRAVNFSDISDEDNEFIDTIDSSDSETIPELSYDRKEFMEIMDRIIRDLPQAQREAVTLFYYKEMSVKQIAGLQEVSEDTVKSRLNYSRKKIGEAVEAYEKKTGTKLYGALLVPLMYLLFYKKSIYAAEADFILTDVALGAANVSHGLAGASSGAAGKAASGITKSALGTTSKALSGTVLKIVIPVAAVAVIGVSTPYVIRHMNKDAVQEPAVTEQAAGMEEYSEPEAEEADAPIPEDTESEETGGNPEYEFNGLKFEFDGETFSISGEGILETRAVEDACEIFKIDPWVQVKRVKIANGVRIENGSCDGAFANFKQMEFIELPNDMTCIPGGMFYGCSSLRSVDIPDTVTQIGKNAFSLCSELKTIKLPDGVKEIPSGCFAECLSLEEVSLGDNTTRIGETAFYECAGLRYIDLPDSIETIEKYAFEDCIALEGIQLPSRIRIVEGWAFSGCEKAFTHLVIPETAEKIESNTFHNCLGITDVVIKTKMDFDLYNEVYGLDCCPNIVKVTLPAEIKPAGEDKLRKLKNHWAQSTESRQIELVFAD